MRQAASVVSSRTCLLFRRVIERERRALRAGRRQALPPCRSSFRTPPALPQSLFGVWESGLWRWSAEVNTETGSQATRNKALVLPFDPFDPFESVRDPTRVQGLAVPDERSRGIFCLEQRWILAKLQPIAF